MTRENDDNRRAFLRFPMDALVWWNQDWEPEPITMVDISAGGMLVEFPQAMAMADDVNLNFEFPGFPRLIQCRCEVVHCRKIENKFYHVGLRIIELEGMDQSELVTRLKKSMLAAADNFKLKGVD